MSTDDGYDGHPFCQRCGSPLQPGSSYCARCGTGVAPSPMPGRGDQPMDWREQRRQWRAQRRAEMHDHPGPHVFPLILATVLVLAGLGILFPELPLEAFWGSVLIVLGVWVVCLWLLGSRGRTGWTGSAPGT